MSTTISAVGVAVEAAKAAVQTIKDARTKAKAEFDELDSELQKQENAAAVYLQHVCPHTNVVKEDDFDHHQREDWTRETCGDCGKFLRKY